jgi:hypothetical protein
MGKDSSNLRNFLASKSEDFSSKHRQGLPAKSSAYVFWKQ